MVRRKKATAALLGDHPARRRAEINPEYPDDDPVPPDYLHPYAVETFNEYYPILTRGGALKSTDRPVFISFCAEAAMVRQASEQLQAGLFLSDASGKLYPNPAEKLFRLHSQNLIKLGVELGMSPRARAGVTITQTDAMRGNDKLAGILNLIDEAKED